MRRTLLPVAALVVTGVLLAASSGQFASAEQIPLVAKDKTPARVVNRVLQADGQTRATIRLGPIPTRPMQGGEHGGGHGGAQLMHGPHEPMHGQHTTVLAPLVPPCIDCYLTSVTPNLTYEDGQPANYDTNVMLHHVVIWDRSKTDPTCGNGQSLFGLTGQRIFASGNERTPGTLPAGYGLYMKHLPLPYAMVELMNMSASPQLVYVDFTVTYVPASTPGMKPVTVVWLDKANCRNSQHNAPEGESHFTWQWKSTLSGTVKTVGGHLHDGGQSISASNATTGKTFCSMVAGYGKKAAYQGHIDTMPTCTGDNLGTISKGDVLQLDSTYHTHYADPAVMSIALLYVATE